MNLNELAGRKSVPNATLLAAGSQTEWLAMLPGWEIAGNELRKTYRFSDYYRTMAFVNAVAYIAHAEDHHPDLQVGYNRCTVVYSTHSAGGVTENDFICAAKVELLGA